LRWQSLLLVWMLILVLTPVLVLLMALMLLWSSVAHVHVQLMVMSVWDGSSYHCDL